MALLDYKLCLCFLYYAMVIIYVATNSVECCLLGLCQKNPRVLNPRKTLLLGNATLPRAAKSVKSWQMAAQRLEKPAPPTATPARLWTRPLSTTSDMRLRKPSNGCLTDWDLYSLLSTCHGTCCGCWRCVILVMSSCWLGTRKVSSGCYDLCLGTYPPVSKKHTYTHQNFSLSGVETGMFW